MSVTVNAIDGQSDKESAIIRCHSLGFCQGVLERQNMFQDRLEHNLGEDTIPESQILP